MADRPIRIQLSRAKGWRMPENSVKVDRSTRWGNSFRVGQRLKIAPFDPVTKPLTAQEAVDAFRSLLQSPIGAGFKEDVISELRGKNLACWCKPGDPCHADVLLEIANA